MKENAFSAQFRGDMVKYCEMTHTLFHLQLIPDTYRGGKRPYDCYLHLRTRFVAIEFKVVKGLSLNSNILSNHQHAKLMEVRGSGGRGVVVVKDDRGKRVICIKIQHWNKIFKNETCKKIDDVLQCFSTDKMPILIRSKYDCGTIWSMDNFMTTIVGIR